MSGDVTMTCQSRLMPESLRIDYEIVNHTDRGVYVYVLPTDSAMEPYHQQTYAALSANQRILYLVLDRSPIGQEQGHNDRNVVPLACYLKPAAQYQDRFVVYLPVREWHAYAVPQQSNYSSSVEVEHAVLSVAYLFEDDTEQVARSKVPGFHEVTGSLSQKLVITLKLPTPITVEKLIDGGERMTF
ncbi:MAG: hypothetical protein MJE77_26615 [Proteobacteria bacterium]|nr:hypothetical protein [Pseudomonadota bacterium]